MTMWSAAIPTARRKLKFNEALKQVLDRLATDLIETTRARNRGERRASPSKTFAGSRSASRDFRPRSPPKAPRSSVSSTRGYTRIPTVAEERDRSVAALDTLCSVSSWSIPTACRKLRQDGADQPRHRVVCDYIAGMTDHFLLRQSRELLGVPVPQID